MSRTCRPAAALEHCGEPARRLERRRDDVLIGLDEEGTLAALRALWPSRSTPGIAVNRGRLVATTGEGKLVGFASVLDRLRCGAGQALPIPQYGEISVFGRHFVGSETCVEIGHLLVRRDLGLSGRYVLLDDGRLPGGVLGVR